jgi:perosamine synthetase
MRLTIPLFDDDEIEEIRQVLSSGYLTQGPKVAEFEKLIATFVGSRFAFATSSCTTALHLSLVALDIGPGDEVLVPDFTFPATANVVVQSGAEPILVDIELETYTVDIEDLRAKVSERSKAIIPVHAFGCAADMNPILQLAEEHGLSIIEDAATALGTTYLDQFCGGIGTLGCFSFHPRKVITTGEGGMITTNDERLADRIQLLRNHGGVREVYWDRFEAAGFNYRLSDVLGAIGIAQMKKLKKIIELRRILAGMLKERLAGIDGLHLPADPPWGGHIYQSFVVRLDQALDRDRLVEDLRNQGIESTLGTYALHDQPFYQKVYGYVSGQLPRSHQAFTSTITLPLYPQMDESDIEIVASGFKAAVAGQIGT